MLLRQIELKGFLSHYGDINGSDEIEYVTVNFEGSPLWLIHGPNGSGKSALFDAITFALFKEYRGGGSNFERLIHHGADGAEVRLEIELDGQRYRIDRTITRRRRGAQVSGIVHRWDGIDWRKEPGTLNDIEAWVRKHLRMSYETFVSAVVLRQGAIDAFLKEKPAKRKDRLMELLDLEFYRKLGEKANEYRRTCAEKLKRCQQDLDEVMEVTDTQLEDELQILETAQQELRDLRERHNRQTALLGEARRAAELVTKIAEKEKLRRADEILFSRAKAIEVAAQRARELREGLLLLDGLWAARRRLTKEAKLLTETRDTLVQIASDLEALASEITQARDSEYLAEVAFREAKTALEQAQEHQRHINDAINQIGQIERLESQIREAEENFAPYRTTIDAAQAIERDYHRYTELSGAIPKIQTVADATQQLTDALARQKDVQTALADKQKPVSQLKAAEQQQQAMVRKKEQAYADHDQVYLTVDRQLVEARVRVGQRDSVIDLDECPTCGMRLDTDEAQAHLEEELTRWQEVVAELKEKTLALSEQRELAQQERDEAVRQAEETKVALHAAEKELARAESDAKNADEDVDKARRSLDKAQMRAGDWSTTYEQLSDLKTELATLQKTSERWGQLAKAREEASASKATIATCQAALLQLPTWEASERARIWAEHENIAQTVVECEGAYTAAEAGLKQATAAREAIEKRQSDLGRDMSVQQRTLDGLVQRHAEAQHEFDQHQRDLPREWVEHPASERADALDALRAERTHLSGTEDEERDLRVARQRADELAGAIATLNDELGRIVLAARRPVPDIEAELVELGKTVDDSETRVREQQQRTSELQVQRRTHLQRRDARDEAACELRLYERLASAFGRNGLQARIVQEAQRAIKHYANTTLGRLSDGRWQIELQEQDDGAALEIMARDLRAPRTPLLEFSNLSDGEKTRVAISLAVAISQSISGGRTVDTLVIDEGFGMLDPHNRTLLVSEVRRLSDEALQGRGRIIVVSHQDDVRDEFGHRFWITRDVQNRVIVERTPE